MPPIDPPEPSLPSDAAARTSRQFSRHNHAVPEGYLRGWSDDGRTVYAYRLLVPAPTFPLWKPQPIQSLLAFRDLYTSVLGGDESDDVEHWLNREFETPAAEPLARLRADKPLRPGDIGRLVRYVAALDQRTPASYFQHQRWVDREMPAILRKALARTKRRLAHVDFESGPSGAATASQASDDNPLPLRVRIERLPDGGGVIHTNVTTGRELWLYRLRHVLTRTIGVLDQHVWAILRPYRDSEWFTSDRPAIRLSYGGPHEYHFEGGWGRKNCEILAPLSPHHLLYAKVGDARPPEGELSRKMTVELQKVIAHAAERWIIARTPAQRAVWFRTRRVDLAAFDAEEKLWKNWHDAQRRGEAGANLVDLGAVGDEDEGGDGRTTPPIGPQNRS